MYFALSWVPYLGGEGICVASPQEKFCHTTASYIDRLISKYFGGIPSKINVLLSHIANIKARAVVFSLLTKGRFKAVWLTDKE